MFSKIIVISLFIFACKVLGIVSIYSPLCEVTVPSLVRPRDDIWQLRETPEKDELDSYMQNKTGCTYMARAYGDRTEPVTSSFEGSRWRLQFAVRGEEKAWLLVKGTTQGYTLVIGDDGNHNTSVYEDGTLRQVSSAPTPGILSDQRYTPFYVQIENGTLTFSKLCVSLKPLLTAPVSIPSSSQVSVRYNTAADMGIKLLICSP